MKLIDEQKGQYSGLSEVAPALEGRSYGPLDEFNKTELDTEGFGIPDQVVQNFRIKQKGMNTRTFSRKTKFRVNQNDILEFNAWIKSKKITPRLREFFDSDLDYENFMVDYQDKTNDPAIIGNEKTFSAPTEKVVIVETTSPDKLVEIIQAIKDHGNPGHSFDIIMDEDSKEEFNWDGDGSDSIGEIKIEDNKLYSNTKPRTKDGLTPKQVVSANKSECDELVERYYKDYKFWNEGIAIKELDECYDECKNDFIRIDSNDKSRKDLLLELASRMVAIEMVDKNATYSHSSTKQFDAIPKDHPDQDLGDNSFIVVKVSPTTGEYFYYDVVSELHPWFDLVSKTKLGQNVPKLIDRKFIVTPQTKGIYLKDANEYLQNMSRKLGLGLYSDGACPESGCVQKKPNGKWGVISNKTGEFWDADYESEDKAKAALAAYHANKAFSELSDKLFADLTVNNDPSILSKKKSGSASTSVGDVVLKSDVPTITADWDRTKPFNLSVEPWIVANCINDKADGLYIGSLLGDTIDIGNSHISIDIKSSSSQPIETLVLLKNGKAFIYKRTQLESKNKTFSDGVQYDYRFSITPTELSYEMPYIIGSWMLAASVCHLYHICDQKYSGHMALDEFYTDFPEKIDALAEHYLADNEKAEFRVCVVPHECPIDYLTRLVEFTMKYSELNKDKISSPYQSQLDDIVNFTKGILYKLKRLGSGRRIFSILSNDTEG